MSAIPISTNIFVTSNNTATDIIYDFSAFATIQPGNVATATNISVAQNDLNRIFAQAVPLGTSISGVTSNIKSTIQGNTYDLGQLFNPIITGNLPFTAIGDYSYLYDYTAKNYYITFNTIGGIQFNTNLSNVQVIVVGGGGAGGGCDTTITGSCGAGGGGGGAISISTAITGNPLSGLVINNMYYINVGLGGNGVSGAAGLSGGTSYFVDISGTALITSTGGQGGTKSNTNSGGGAGGSSTYASFLTSSITGYGGTGGSNNNGSSVIGGFGTQGSLSYQNYLNNFVLGSATTFKNSLTLYNSLLFSGGGGGAVDGSGGAGYSGGGGFGTYKVGSSGTYGFSTTGTFPIFTASGNYYINQMPSSNAIQVTGAVSGLCPGAGGGGVGSKIYTIAGNTIGGNGSPGTVKISFTSSISPNLSSLFTISGNAKQYSINLANGSQYYLVYCYPGTSTLSFFNNTIISGASILGIGGGGGGAGGGYFTASGSLAPGTFTSGAGGGGGGVALLPTSLFGTYSITVGSGGTGGYGGAINTSAINGSIGGNTTIINGSASILTCTGGSGGNAFLNVSGGSSGTVQCNYSFTGGQGGQGGQGGKGYNGSLGSNTIPLSGTSSSLLSYTLPDGTTIYGGGGGGGGSARYSDSKFDSSGNPKIPLNYNGGAAGYGYGGLVGTCINAADPSLNSLDLSANGGTGIFWGSGGGGGSSNANITNKTYGGSGGDGAVLFIIPANALAQLSTLQQNITNTSNALSIAQTALANYVSAGYNSWFSPASINNSPQSWVGIGIANNGYIFACTFQTPIYVSPNYGSSFTSISVGTGHREIAISANGQYGIVCNPGPNYLYTTNNFGNTWVQTSNYDRWQTIAASSTCQYSIAGTNGTGIWYSSNYGSTYTLSNIYDGFSQLAMSSTGQYCIASYYSGQPFNLASTGQIYYSSNYGQSWTVSNTPFSGWGKCTIEDNGIGYAVNNYIYTTTNYGQTWSAITSSGALGWSHVRMDSSGQNLLGAQNSIGYIYSSSDYGQTWSQTNCPYMSNILPMCISRDGKYAAVGGYNDYFYITPFSSNTTSYATLVANVATAQTAYNNALAAYNSAYNILSNTSIMPTAPSINSISNIGYTIVNGISSYGLYSLSNTYNAGISNIITNTINSNTNGNITIGALITNSTYYNYLIGYNNIGTATLQSVSAFIDISMGSISNNIIPSNGLPTTGSSYSICSDPTGQYLGLCIYGGGVYNSSNYGQSWTINNNFPIGNWRSICNYVNNTNISYSACNSNGQIYTLSPWNITPAPAAFWTGIASSSTGQILVACAYKIGIYLSINYGVTWTLSYSNTTYSWYGITCDISCTNIRVISSEGKIVESKDGGTTWAINYSGTQSWYSITSSSNGNIIATCANSTTSNGYIYVSTTGNISNLSAITTSIGNLQWSSVALSADGTKLVASVNNITSGYIYTMSNTGTNYVQTLAPPAYWNSVCCNTTFTILAGCYSGGSTAGISVNTNSGTGSWMTTTFSNIKLINITCNPTGSVILVFSSQGIYISTNYGTTWNLSSIPIFSLINWGGVSISSDLTRLVYCGGAVTYANNIYTLICSNISSVPINTLSITANWQAICSNLYGTVLAACIYGSGIYTSTNTGLLWTNSSAPSLNWTAICCDISGINITASTNGSGIYTSTNGGQTWSQTSAPTLNWSSICNNNTGQTIIACSNGSGIYISINRGQTWSQTSAPSANWTSIACNYTASIITACINNGTIWLSTNSGSTWTNSYSPVSSWNALCLDSSGIYLATTINPMFAFTFTISNGILTSTSKYISNICSDPTGQYLGLTTYGGSVYNSTNYGASWTTNSNYSTGNWQAICSYSNGTNYIPCINGGNITFPVAAWIQRASSQIWYSIASSSDGTKLAAGVRGGYIWTSIDSGVSWTQQTNSGSQIWCGIASSSDGTKLAAVGNGGYIYTSTDSGVSWTQRASSQGWIGIASSSDGTKLAAVVNGGYIYTSTDSGVSWTQRASSQNWLSIASSSNGTILAAVVQGGYIWTSTNSGVSWTQRASSQNWWSIASSSDGTKLAAVVYSGYIWTSTDSGVTWIQKTSTSYNWVGIASSSDGTKLAAVVYGGYIYTIAQKFSPSVANWQSICCDLSGTNIAACIDGSGIYISSNNGTSWSNSNAPIASWTSICCDYSCTYLAACANNSGIYTSTNNGSTWNITTAPSVNWVSICSNSTGQYLAACIFNGTIYTSANYGSSWINTGLPSLNWTSISSSSTGSTLAACIQGGIIYISFNYGSTWSYINTNSNWTAIVLSANGTYISATSLNGSVYNFTLSLYTLATPTISNLTTTSVTINYTTVILGQSYAVYLYTTNTFTPITPGVIFQTTNSTNNGSFIFNITSGTAYYAAVIGYTQKNQKGIAFQSSYTNSIIYLSTPVTPTIGIVTSSSAVINYTSIAGAQSYTTYVYTNNTFTPTTSGVISASVNSTVSGSITVSGLSSGTTYYAIIVAYSQVNGSGTASAQSSYSSSFIYLQTPSNPTIGTIGSSTVVINYTSINGAQSYSAYVYTNNTFIPSTSGVISASVNSTVSGSITVSGLTPVTTYYAIIVAYSQVNGSGAASAQSGYSSSFTTSSFGVVSATTSPVIYSPFTLYTFTSSGSIVLTGNNTIYYVIVGGGASPAYNSGNPFAGGAGGSVRSGTINNSGSSNTTYTITVGNGGSASGTNTSGVSGSPSSIVYSSTTLTAAGGNGNSTAGTTTKGLTGITNVSESGTVSAGGTAANAVNCTLANFNGQSASNVACQGYTVNIGSFIGKYSGGGGGGDSGNNTTNNAWGGGHEGTCNIGGAGSGTSNTGGGAGGDHGTVVTSGGSGIVLIFY